MEKTKNLNKIFVERTIAESDLYNRIENKPDEDKNKYELFLIIIVSTFTGIGLFFIVFLAYRLIFSYFFSFICALISGFAIAELLAILIFVLFVNSIKLREVKNGRDNN